VEGLYLLQILVVDDTTANLKLLTEILVNEGYQVRPASSGSLALKSVAVEKPDLIILDIKMPDMDGYEVCRRLKSDKLCNKIPIIFISALDDTTDIVKGFTAGGIDYITKPFHAEEVLARVENHLSLAILQKQLEAQNVQLRQEIAEREQIKEKLREANNKLEQRVKERTKELKQINEQLLEEIEERKQIEEELQHVRDGLEMQVEMRTQELAKVNAKLQVLSSLDGLTGLANRRYLDEFWEREWQRGQRQGTSVALIMIDLDYFKGYNDAYGHLVGDDCLKLVASTLKTTLKRKTDLAARYGGEEFAVLLPETDIEGAAILAEEIRIKIEALGIKHEKSLISQVVTVSLGVAAIIPQQGMEATQMIAIADSALYQAKHEGRNRVKIGKSTS